MKKISLYVTFFLVLVNAWTIHAGVQGALPGAFSVSATKKVYFSQGNLQYRKSTKVWRFGEYQYSFVGNDRDANGSGHGNVYQDGVRSNNSTSTSYTGWMDLFGWGTGSAPTKISTANYEYSTFTDWGVNKISNGGNQANLWRTLSKAEFEYIYSGRANAANKRSKAKVNGVRGYIFLPDSWTLPSGLSFVANASTVSEVAKNTYTIEQWQKMEQNGAVFLPVTGIRTDQGPKWAGYDSGG